MVTAAHRMDEGLCADSCYSELWTSSSEEYIASHAFDLLKLTAIQLTADADSHYVLPRNNGEFKIVWPVRRMVMCSPGAERIAEVHMPIDLYIIERLAGVALFKNTRIAETC